MKKARSGDVCDRRPHLLPRMNDVNSKCIDGVPSDVVAVDSRDEHLAFVIIHEQSANHPSKFKNLSEKKFI